MLSNNLTYFNYEKKIFLYCSICYSGSFAYLNSESRSDDMFSANVEALARDESRGVKCFYQLTADPNDQVTYCGTCSELPGRGSRKGTCYKN